ncbi:5-dehydro-4-deoxyglucarate dehydratase [Novosphingobium sp. 1949]|uniref:Probable 5-dehydro-4-deoxyglucarate dehydratase n=1 Tax=Novosphingobium organovorum TaxID=2930092 RepID=A0ABT0BBW1_9SPHN|nr:5-dehydro-4-deoxyglucarate dehydratase [Novosphingobium organovorum]MCJ2182533.1 5-dehydro-4-deoxyglucarate dehydratase [Novosphingobium organovorum]
MSRYTPAELGQVLGAGLLSFPITHFAQDFSFDEKAYRENLEWLSTYPVAGLFAAGGTGEFFSLTNAEVVTVVKAAVEQIAGRVPVIAPAGGSTAQAIELAQAAEASGADGILLFPPYLTECDTRGVADHVIRVCQSTKLGVSVYSRANAKLTDEHVARIADACPNLIGYKDGVGEIERMTRIYNRLGDRLTYIGGLPTAETFALPYLEMGVTTYSSAVFNFLPGWALEFYKAVRARDRATVDRELREFIIPYTRIRDRCAGYAVSIVKAGMTAIGRPAGPVRTPLLDLSEAEVAELKALIGDRA